MLGGGILQALVLIAIGFALGAGGYAFITTMLDAARDAFSRPFGDVVELPGEAIVGDACNLRAGSGKADATDIQGLVALHPETRQ
jgi:hypothetical protein